MSHVWTIHLHGVEGHGHGPDEDVGDGERGDEEVGGLPDLAVDHEADEDEEVSEGGDHDADGQAHRDEDGQQGAEGRRPALGAAGGAVRPWNAIYGFISRHIIRGDDVPQSRGNTALTLSHNVASSSDFFVKCFKMLLGLLSPSLLSSTATYSNKLFPLSFTFQS